MLLLIQKLPDDSAFKTALRDDWNIDQHLSAAVVSELRGVRGDLWAMRGQVFPFQPVESPKVRRSREEKRAEFRALHDRLSRMMRGKKS